MPPNWEEETTVLSYLSEISKIYPDEKVLFIYSPTTFRTRLIFRLFDRNLLCQLPDERMKLASGKSMEALGRSGKA
jgi:hypothetical protein